MYSIKALLEKEPVIIAGAIRSILYMLVVLGAITLEAPQLAVIALALEGLLGLFARANSTSVASPTLPQGTTVSVVTPAGQPNTVTTV